MLYIHTLTKAVSSFFLFIFPLYYPSSGNLFIYHHFVLMILMYYFHAQSLPEIYATSLSSGMFHRYSKDNRSQNSSPISPSLPSPCVCISVHLMALLSFHPSKLGTIRIILKSSLPLTFWVELLIKNFRQKEQFEERIVI